jgi:pimeloyl-ACP methyl ester carboxylesterase
MYKKIVIAIVVLLGALFFYATIGRKDLTRTKAEVKAKYSLPNSHFISWKGAEIHYTEAGQGMPVLMIHGFGGSSRDFLVLDSLINDKYRVIRVDLPGFGMSDFPQLTGEVDFMKEYDAYFNFMMDTLHIDSCFVIGNSLGGMMAWNLTLKHPEKIKKLVLFNSAGYDMPQVMKTANASLLQNSVVKMVVKKGAPKFVVKLGVQRVVYDASSLTEERLQRLTDMWNREGNMNHLIAMANSKTFPDEAQIKNIHCPTLIFWGQQDKIVNAKYAERFHQDIKGSRVVMYDKCGHVPMLEKPLEVQKEVLGFLGE